MKSEKSIKLLFILVVPLSIIIAAFAAYSNSFHCPFVFDTDRMLMQGEEIKEPSYYFSFAAIHEPRAIVDLTFALNRHVHGLDVFGYHLVNIIIHIINGFLMYILARLLLNTLTKLPRNALSVAALFAALIFVMHPIQTQAVTYVAQRYASMAAIFYLATVILYLKFRFCLREKGTGASSTIYLVLAIVSGMLAFMAKGNTASLPGVIVLVEYLCFDRSWIRWKKKLPWFALSFACWLLFVLFVVGVIGRGTVSGNLLEDVSSEMKETELISRDNYFYTQLNVLVIYLRLLILPVRQNLDYVYPFKAGFFDGATPLAAFFLFILAFIGFRVRRRAPVITFSIFWFFITLSVESSIIPIRDALFEHRLYLAMPAFALAISYVVTAVLAPRFKTATAILLVIVISLGTATYFRNMVWRDKLTIWSDVVSKSPHNPRAHYNLGLAQFNGDDVPEAIASYEKAISLLPNYAQAHNNLGAAYNKAGNRNKAVTHLEKAIELDPANDRACFNLGAIHHDTGRLAEAAGYLEQAIGTNPLNTDALNRLGAVYLNQERIEEAITCFEQVTGSNPDNATAYNNLGFIRKSQGRYDEAAAHFEKALALDPEFADSHFNLASLLAERGDMARSIPHYQQAIKLKPGLKDAYNNLGIAYYSTGRIGEAIEAYREAVRASPDFTDAWNNLGIACCANKETAEAIAAFTKVTELAPEYRDAYFNLALIYRDQGNTTEAQAALQEVLEINPEDLKSLTLLGDIAYDTDDMNEAATYYRKAIKILPESAALHFKFGNLQFKIRNYSRAINLFTKATEFNPDHAEAYYNCANTHYILGKTVKALPLYQKTLEIKPDHVSAHKNLAITAFNEKLYDLAIKHCDRALELGAVMSPEFLEALKPYRNQERPEQ